MSDLESLRSLLATRSDDLDLRRVFADALAQAGDLRGEVLLRELALLDGTLSAEARRKAQSELKQWRGDARALWLAKAMHVELEHGLPRRAVLSDRMFLDEGAAAVLDELPAVRELELRGVGPVWCAEYAKELQALVDHPFFASVRQLTVSFPFHAHEPFFDVKFPPKVELVVTGEAITVVEIQRLVDLRLEALTISVDALAPSPQTLWNTVHSGALRRLGVAQVQHRQADVEAIAATQGRLPAFNELRLGDLRLFATAGFAAWAGSEFTRRVRVLDFTGSVFAGSFGRSLVDAGPFPMLEELRLERARAEELEYLVPRLADPGFAPKLKILDLRDVKSAVGPLLTSLLVTPVRVERLLLEGKRKLSGALRERVVAAYGSALAPP